MGLYDTKFGALDPEEVVGAGGGFIDPEKLLAQRREARGETVFKPDLTLRRAGGAVVEELRTGVRDRLIGVGLVEEMVEDRARTFRKQRGEEIKALQQKTGQSKRIKRDQEFAQYKNASVEILALAASEKLKANPEFQVSSGWIEDQIRTTAQVGQQIVTAVVGGPTIAMGDMGLMIMGGTYTKLVAEGVEPERARTAAFANAVMQSPLEYIGVGKAAKLFKPRKRAIKFLKEIGEVGGVEGLTEYLQTLGPEEITALWAKNPEASPKELWNKWNDRIKSAELQKEAGKSAGHAALATMMFGAAGAARRSGQTEQAPGTPDPQRIEQDETEGISLAQAERERIANLPEHEKRRLAEKEANEKEAAFLKALGVKEKPSAKAKPKKKTKKAKSKKETKQEKPEVIEEVVEEPVEKKPAERKFGPTPNVDEKLQKEEDKAKVKALEEVKVENEAKKIPTFQNQVEAVDWAEDKGKETLPAIQTKIDEVEKQHESEEDLQKKMDLASEIDALRHAEAIAKGEGQLYEQLRKRQEEMGKESRKTRDEKVQEAKRVKDAEIKEELEQAEHGKVTPGVVEKLPPKGKTGVIPKDFEGETIPAEPSMPEAKKFKIADLTKVGVKKKDGTIVEGEEIPAVSPSQATEANVQEVEDAFKKVQKGNEGAERVFITPKGEYVPVSEVAKKQVPKAVKKDKKRFPDVSDRVKAAAEARQKEINAIARKKKEKPFTPDIQKKVAAKAKSLRGSAVKFAQSVGQAGDPDVIGDAANEAAIAYGKHLQKGKDPKKFSSKMAMQNWFFTMQTGGVGSRKALLEGKIRRVEGDAATLSDRQQSDKADLKAPGTRRGKTADAIVRTEEPGAGMIELRGGVEAVRTSQEAADAQAFVDRMQNLRDKMFKDPDYTPDKTEALEIEKFLTGSKASTAELKRRRAAEAKQQAVLTRKEKATLKRKAATPGAPTIEEMKDQAKRLVQGTISRDQNAILTEIMGASAEPGKYDPIKMNERVADLEAFKAAEDIMNAAGIRRKESAASKIRAAAQAAKNDVSAPTEIQKKHLPEMRRQVRLLNDRIRFAERMETIREKMVEDKVPPIAKRKLRKELETLAKKTVEADAKVKAIEQKMEVLRLKEERKAEQAAIDRRAKALEVEKTPLSLKEMESQLENLDVATLSDMMKITRQKDTLKVISKVRRKKLAAEGKEGVVLRRKKGETTTTRIKTPAQKAIEKSEATAKATPTKPKGRQFGPGAIIKNEKGGTEVVIPGRDAVLSIPKRAGAAWTGLVDRTFTKLSESRPAVWAANQNAVDFVLSGIVERHGQSKTFQTIEKDYDLNIHRANLTAKRLATELEQIDTIFRSPSKQFRKIDILKGLTGEKRERMERAFEARKRQIAEGGITMYEDKFRAARLAADEFAKLETELRERGLLVDHQFREMNRKERAAALRKVKFLEDKMQMIEDSDALDVHQKKKNIAKVEKERNDILTRLQIHYKNSGKNYLTYIKDEIEQTERYRRQLTIDAMGKKWAKRRRNWTVTVEDGIVKVRRAKQKQNLKKTSSLVGKGITQEAHDLHMHDLFTNIAKSSEEWTVLGEKTPWAADPKEINAKGIHQQTGQVYKRMPKDAVHFGPLAGMWVHKPIFKQLQSDFKDLTEFQKGWRKAFGTWKAGKTVWSPPTTFRNAVSNLALMHVVGDVNILKPSTIRSMGRNFKEVWDFKKNQIEPSGKYSKEILEDTTIYSSDFVSIELDKVQGDLITKAIEKAADFGGTPAGLAKFLRDNSDVGPVLYQTLEVAGKSVVYKHARENLGMSIEAAEDLAHRALFDYSKVPAAIQWARNWYSPFITFSYKAAKELPRAIVRKPWKMIPYYGLLYAADEFSSYMFGEDEDDLAWKKRVLPDYMRRDSLPGVMESHMRMPFKTPDGEEKWMDLSFFLPWGAMTDNGEGVFSYAPSFLAPTNPLLTIPASLLSNQDLFTGKEIVNLDTDSGGQVIWKIYEKIYNEVMPAALDTRKWDKLLGAVYGHESIVGTPKYSVGDAVVDMLFGVKFRNIDYMEESMWRQKELQQKASSLRKEYSKKLTDAIVRKRNDPRNQKAEELQNELQDKMEDLMDEYHRAFMRESGNE